MTQLKRHHHQRRNGMEARDTLLRSSTSHFVKQFASFKGGNQWACWNRPRYFFASRIRNCSVHMNAELRNHLVETKYQDRVDFVSRAEGCRVIGSSVSPRRKVIYRIIVIKNDIRTWILVVVIRVLSLWEEKNAWTGVGAGRKTMKWWASGMRAGRSDHILWY